MKGLKQCGLLLALFITLGLSFVISSDVSALKHNVDVIPLFTPYDYAASDGDNLYRSLFFYFENYSEDLADDWYFKAKASGGGCSYESYHNARSQSENAVFYNGRYFLDDVPYANSVSNIVPCQKRGPLNNFDVNSLPPYVFGIPNLKGLVPYWYSYFGAERTSTVTQDGIQRSAKFDFSDLFIKGIPSRIKQMRIPIGIPDPGSVGHIASNRTLLFEGEMLFDSENPDTDVFTLQSRSEITLHYSGYTSEDAWKGYDDGYYSGDVSCTYEVKRNDVDGEYPWILNYQCPFTSPATFEDGLIGFDINFFNPDYLWDYPAINWLYDQSFVITDGDDTPGGSFSKPNDGGDLEHAPGSAYIDSGNVNWFGSLANMFSFGFLNPFAPIFQLFSDNESCAQIPTIAGMIHSEETQVCPWFSSSTRSIVTPVLGLASMMLVFGFTVHWLGARSGNMFEDSVNTDNYSFRSRVGGRKK